MSMGGPQRVLAVLAASLVALTAAFVAQSGAEASSSLSQVESARQSLNLDLHAAASQGYSDQEVGPILDRQQALLSAVAPSGSSDRAVFYRGQALELSNLRVALSALEVRQLDLLRRATATRLNSLVDELGQDAKLGVDPADLAPLKLQVDSLQTTMTYARSPADYRHAFAEMGAPIDQAQQLRAARAADLAAVQAVAQSLDARGALRDGVDVSAATDVLYMIAGPETFRQLVRDRGWSPRRYERWLVEAGKHLLL